MPSIFDEGMLRLEFSDDWVVIRLDEHEFFRKRLMPMQQTKAVDFVALYKQHELYFIEVKDYRGRPIEMKNAESRAGAGPLHLQVARKVKDSIACIVGAARTLPRDDFWIRCAQAIHNRQRPIRVVFWLEFDIPGAHGRSRPTGFNERRFRQIADNRRERGKQSLSWLTKEFQILNQHIGASVVPGVTVSNIGRAGNP